MPYLGMLSGPHVAWSNGWSVAPLVAQSSTVTGVARRHPVQLMLVEMTFSSAATIVDIPNRAGPVAATSDDMVPVQMSCRAV